MGQLVRQGGRFVAIYFSDVLLWLSVAGILEIFSFLVAGALCILTAGFIFEGMKKSPVVMVLGTAVALTGTFLVFREVRGLIWPPASTAAAPVKAPGSLWPPPAISKAPSALFPPNFPTKTTATPSPLHLPKTTLKPAKPRSSDCASRGPGTCDPSNGCIWSLISNRCKALSGAAFPVKPPAPATLNNTSFCGVHPKITCATYSKCYWSSLTNRCEKLRIGGGLFTGALRSPPSGVSSCAGKTLLQCLSDAHCAWSSKLKSCYPETGPPSAR